MKVNHNSKNYSNYQSYWKSIVYFTQVCTHFPKFSLALTLLINSVRSVIVIPCILSVFVTLFLCALVHIYQLSMVDIALYNLQLTLFMFFHVLGTLISIICIIILASKLFINSSYFKQSGRFYLLNMRMQHPDQIVTWSQVWSLILLLPLLTIFSYLLSVLFLSFDINNLDFRLSMMYEYTNIILNNSGFFYLMLAKSFIFALLIACVSLHFSLVVKNKQDIIHTAQTAVVYSIVLVLILDLIISYSLYT
jgi:hypothetical protein